MKVIPWYDDFVAVLEERIFITGIESPGKSPILDEPAWVNAHLRFIMKTLDGLAIWIQVYEGTTAVYFLIGKRAYLPCDKDWFFGGAPKPFLSSEQDVLVQMLNREFGMSIQQCDLFKISAE